jgi:hypothetical protein
MKKLTLLLPLVCAAAGLVAAVALSSAPPVGPLPPGPVQAVKRPVGETFAVNLPKPAIAGLVWRVARTYDPEVIRELTESTTAAGGVRSVYRAVGPGATRLVYALTRGETARAFAARTFAVTVKTVGAGCPNNLLPLTANPIGPSVIAALVGDEPMNRPQVDGASVASHDTQRGSQVKAQCGSTVSSRTVVVYITDRALLPSQSASQRVLFVGRTKVGYRVWRRAH